MNRSRRLLAAVPPDKVRECFVEALRVCEVLPRPGLSETARMSAAEYGLFFFEVLSVVSPIKRPSAGSPPRCLHPHPANECPGRVRSDASSCAARALRRRDAATTRGAP